MKKTWITGLTVAAVAGTGGAAFASMQASTHDNTADAASQPAVSAVETTLAARAYSYQAGPAGTVNLTVDDGVMKVDSALPAAGWTVVSYTSPAGHLEVAFTDGLQVVTFIADLSGDEVLASLSAAPAPTIPTTAPAPAPATSPVSLAPSSQSPAPSHTSAPSGSGDDEHEEHEDDDDHDHDHEEEHEDEGDDD
ncbi:MAG: hypothetical protein RL238_1853 [Actinomycetota bacterium]|jgi:hypothetical protein